MLKINYLMRQYLTVYKTQFCALVTFSFQGVFLQLGIRLLIHHYSSTDSECFPHSLHAATCRYNLGTKTITGFDTEVDERFST